MSEPKTKLRFGDQLVAAGLITESQLKLALKEQKRIQAPLGRTLINLGFLTEQKMAEALAENSGIKFVSLKNIDFDRDLARSVPPELARKYLFTPIKREQDSSITVAMAHPDDVISVDAIQNFFGESVNVLAALESEISTAISMLMEIEEDVDDTPGWGDTQEEEEYGVNASQISYVEVVDRIIEYAMRNQATDIHIEPEKLLLRVRYRIDGILHAGDTYPFELISPVVTRVKIMSKLNITERRVPQDGRISIDYNNRKIDLRVSTMPTAHGENIVIRILDRGSTSLDLKGLGISSRMISELNDLASQPHGMILVSGPTGSGKTTTLYSLLLSIDSMAKKVITVEDPIEYELPLIRQSQVDYSIDYTFASGLKTILRQDPDVILVGEIRDQETADVAMRASLTGHLVLSSIHTNTALGVVPRLLDIGVEPFLISSSLTGMIAQRLVRMVCSDCKEAYHPTDEEAEWLGFTNTNKVLYRAKGCDLCRQTGYSKRTAIFEFIRMDSDMTRLITDQCKESDLEDVAKEKGAIMLLDDGKSKVRMGLTTTQEILRVCQNH